MRQHVKRPPQSGKTTIFLTDHKQIHSSYKSVDCFTPYRDDRARGKCLRFRIRPADWLARLRFSAGRARIEPGVQVADLSAKKKMSDADNDPTARERLIQVAAKHFADHGFEGASLRA